ncbi:MAG: tyrosine--tRNA ligase [Syntrophobacteraceae bacterium]
MSPDRNAFDVLEERGFIAQSTDEAETRARLASPITCYIGFDPTADSLHIGSLVPIMALVHMQRLGHRPIVLIGGGTGLVGDPSGKTEMRQLLTVEQIQANASALKAQLSHYLDFSEEGALMLNNADWLVTLTYIGFLRDIGRHFSVNRMLAAESYRMRLETGLNFIEFNYMLLQAYDFLYLRQNHDCCLQMGGSDQWGNIVAGIDLIRRKIGKEAYAITFPLLTTASGQKMGKTAAGAVWLSGEKTSPYDFYQFWVNTDDRDVVRFLKLYTLLPLAEIEATGTLEGQDLNVCKTILAFEVTGLAHGRENAMAAHEAAAQLFGRRALPDNVLPSSSIPRGAMAKEDSIPTTHVEAVRMAEGVPAYVLFVETGLCASKSAARRLIDQGGAYVNEVRLSSSDTLVSLKDAESGKILLRAGKKHKHRIRVSG